MTRRNTTAKPLLIPKFLCYTVFNDNVKESAMLSRIYLEITNICNRSCAFCPGTKRPARMLTPEEFALLAGRLRPHTDYLYLHVMGEPLLHPQLGELLDIASRLGFRVIVTTNGTLLKNSRTHC